MVKIPGNVLGNLGIFFDGISGIIENFVFHSQEMSGLLASLPSVSSRGHLKKQLMAGGAAYQ